MPRNFGYAWPKLRLQMWTGWFVIILPAVIVVIWRGVTRAQEAMAGFLVDDAYISLRHAQHFVQGHGFTYNAGERIEGYSNFLWTALAAIPHALDSNPEAVMQGLGIASAAGLVVALTVLGKRYGGWLAAAAIAASLAMDDRLVGFAVWGLEITFYPMLCAWALVALVTARPTISGVIFALAAMTRMEAVLLVTAAGAFLLCRGMLRSIRDVRTASASEWIRAVTPLASFSVSFILIFGTYFIVRWTYYGYLLPNTFYAKVGSPLNSAERGLDYMFAMLVNMNWIWVIGCAFILILIAAFRRNSSTGTRATATTATWDATLEDAFWLAAAVIYTAYHIAVGGDFMGPRYIYHMFPVALVSLIILLRRSLTAIWPETRSRVWMTTKHYLGGIATLAVGLPLALTQANLGAGAGGWASNGLWVKQNTQPDALIATGAAGALPYYAERRTIDMFGLANIHIAHTHAPNMGAGPVGHEKRDPRYVLQNAPAVIASWMNDAGHLQRGLRERFQYRSNYKTVGVLVTPGRELDPDPLKMLPDSPDARRRILSDREDPHWGVAKRRDTQLSTVALQPEDLSTTATDVSIGRYGALARAEPGRRDAPIVRSIEMYFEPASYTWTFAMKAMSDEMPAKARCKATVWRHDHDGFTNIAGKQITLTTTSRTERLEVTVSVPPSHVELGHGTSVTCRGQTGVSIQRIAITKRD